MSDRWLEKAERLYRKNGVLPFHMAVALMNCGYIVEILEKQWSRQPSEVSPQACVMTDAGPKCKQR